MAAYGLTNFYRLSGPSGINTGPYTVEAIAPLDATGDQIREMLQNLLAERFKITLHRESRVFEVYELTSGKAGPMLRKSVQSPNPCVLYSSSIAPLGPVSPVENTPPKDIFLAAGPGVVEWRGPSGPVRAIGGNMTMSALADYLSGGGVAGRLVIDKTALTGEYDFNLNYEPGPHLLTAVEEQLGLKLVTASEPIEVLVVDHFQPSPTPGR